MEDSIYEMFYKAALEKINLLESRQEVQRQNSAAERDAALIAGKLTDEFYLMVVKAV